MFLFDSLDNNSDKLNFVAIDFETANSNQCSPCSVGLVKVENGVISEEKHFFLNPPEGYRYFGEYQVKVHGITPDMIKKAPGFEEVFDEMLETIDGLPLVAHNAVFDSAVLRKTCQVLSLPIPNLQYGCSLLLSKKALPNLQSHKLPSVLAVFSEERFQHHDALADSRACAKIVLHLANNNSLNSFSQVFSYYDVPLKQL